MKVLLLSGFAVLVLASAPTLARASKASPTALLQEAATQCFAETILSNPKAMQFARMGRWYEAAGVIGFLCRPEVDAMVSAHDRRHGRGTGVRYFRGPYVRHLGQELAVKLGLAFETQAVASAVPADRGGETTAKADFDSAIVSRTAH